MTEGKPGSATAVPQRAVQVEARRLDGSSPKASAADFSYSVIATPPPRRAPPPSQAAPEPAGDKRHASRQRTRLRTGKILDAAGRFVTECLVFDRSGTGSRLRLPAGVTLAARTIHFYDDQQEVLCVADVAWRDDREIGVKFRADPATPQTRALAEEMRRRYYAVPK